MALSTIWNMGRRTVGRVAVVVLVSLVTVPALAGLAVASGLHLGAEDVPFNVTVTNNTSRAIVDHSFFGADYGTRGTSDNDQVVVLKPGHSFGEAQYPNEGVDPDRITSLNGKTLGCLPFQFSEFPPKSLDVKVTEMVPCRHWPELSKEDWPDPKY